MLEAHGLLRLPVNGEDIAVPHAAHLRCPACKEIVLRLDDARRLGEDAIALGQIESRLRLRVEFEATMEVRQRVGTATLLLETVALFQLVHGARGIGSERLARSQSGYENQKQVG
jgi:hypothetical protein